MLGTRPSRIKLAAALLLTATAGCGGGGGGGGEPPPPPANQAPSFTSATTATVTENATGTVYTATATDPDGNALTFSLLNEGDAAAFAITPQGVLTFTAAPDFERPRDADQNNVYQIRIGVSDGQTSVAQDVTVTVTNSREGLQVRRVATGFLDVVTIHRAPPSSDPAMNGQPENLPQRIFIAQRSGPVTIFSPGTGDRKTFINPATNAVFAGFTAAGEGGVLDFRTSDRFGVASEFWLVSYTTAQGIDIRVGSTLFDDRDTARTLNSSVTLSIPYPANAVRYGGRVAWRPDDTIYVATGDGGVPADAQDAANRRGKLLHHILFGATTIQASGLRDPAAIALDAAFGLTVPDRGESQYEEVNLFRPADLGANYGWPFFEGTTRIADGGPATLPPILQYRHGTGPLEGTEIVGGLVYNGPLAALAGQYIFADRVTGNIWAAPVAELAQGSTLASTRFARLRQDLTPDQGTIDRPTAIGVDYKGNIYIADEDGEIFIVEPAP